MSRIYAVKAAVEPCAIVRYVRASTLNGAIRAVAAERFTASAATTEEIFQASKSGKFDVLDALAPEPVLGRTDDPAEQTQATRHNSRMPLQ